MHWLARHGETTWNVAGRYQGRLESPLSELGERQARALGAYFELCAARGEAVPARVVSSPLQRCAQTARRAAEALGLRVETDERLIEIAHGTWEGRYRDELERDDPLRYRAWRQDPARVAFQGGESLGDVRARWRAFARDLELATDATLVVTHDAVVRCALLDIAHRPLDDFWKMRVENAAFATLDVANGRLTLREECRTEHLAGLRASTEDQAL